MPITIGANIAALSSQRRLSQATAQVSITYERLSSGLRVNKASDDAAGLAIATKLNVNSRVYSQALKNVNDGISFLSITEAAVEQMKGILIRQRELATQGASGTYSDEQRRALNVELQQLSGEYNRIIDSTSYNGTNVFDRSSGALTLQAGYGSSAVLSQSFETEAARSQDDMRALSLLPNGDFVSESVTTVGADSPKVSADGRYVAFLSARWDLVDGDTNGMPDLFVRDLLLGETSLVSVSSELEQADSQTEIGFSISADGRFVTFSTSASNLVEGDTNGQQDIFVRDLQEGTTTRVSVGSSGQQADGYSSRSSISADGRYVVFESSATNLVSGDTNGVPDVFVRDLHTGITTIISRDSGGGPSNDASGSSIISADGRYVTFTSNASDLVSGDTNGTSDVFMRDLQTGITTRLSVDSQENQGNGDSGGSIAMSSDGRYVAFTSTATNLTGGVDANGAVYDLFVRDTLAGTTTLVSKTSGGLQGTADILSGSISGDGRYIAFATFSALTGDDTNGAADSYIHDLQSGVTARVSPGTGGAGDGYDTVSISADGRYITFSTDASNVMPEDPNTVRDIFTVGNPLINWSQVSRSSWLSVKTPGDALASQGRLDSMLDELSTFTGQLGAFSSRLSSAVATLSSLTMNSREAAGRIVEADVADEAAKLVRGRIAQQAGAAILAQANSAPELALMLLAS